MGIGQGTGNSSCLSGHSWVLVPTQPLLKFFLKNIINLNFISIKSYIKLKLIKKTSSKITKTSHSIIIQQFKY